MMHNRENALALLRAHTPSESLQRHCMAVESCLRWYAEKLGADSELWGNTGLLHDFDYEQHPDEHPLWGIEELKTLGWPQELLDAIAAHYPAKTGVHPVSPLQRHLFACDELSGLITAVTYVRPSRSIFEVEVKSVLKKFKTPSFAAGVNRADVSLGAELIGVSLDDHVGNCLSAMQRDADALNLAGIA
jgi:putative nucleotidyltransferase with HDIG domain